MENNKDDSSFLNEIQNRRYVTKTTMTEFYNKLAIRRNEYSLLFNQLEELLNLYQSQINTKKKLKKKLKESQSNYVLAYTQIEKDKIQSTMFTN